MNNRQLIAIIIVLMSFCTRSNGQTDLGVEKNVIISGTILNYEIGISPQTIEITRRDFFDLDEKYVERINEDGSFKIVFPIAYIQESYIEYGNLFSLLCVPGDSLTIQINNNILQDKESLKYITFSDNEMGKTSWLMNKFKAQLPNENYIYLNFQKAEKELPPDEYTKYIGGREKKYDDYLDTFKKANQTTVLFETWVEDYLKYHTWESLMSYRSMHPLHNKIERDSFKLPTNYFNFLGNYDMNDKECWIQVLNATFFNSSKISKGVLYPKRFLGLLFNMFSTA